MTDIYNIGLQDRDRVAASFGGGFPKGSIVFIEGGDGSGKSVLSQRITYGLCEENNTVTYVTPQFDSGTFVKQMSSLDYPVKEYMLVNQSLLFINADVDTQQRIPEKSKVKRNLLRHLFKSNSYHIWDNDVILFDSLDILIRNDPEFERLRTEDEINIGIQDFIQYLKMIKNTGRTVFITMNNEQTNEDVLRPFRNHSDVYLKIQTTRKSGSLNRSLEVKKFTQMFDNMDTVISFEVQQGNGIVINTQSIA